MSESGKIRPPKLASRFLRWFCPTSLYESIEGDLLEQFEIDIKVVGVGSARKKFIWNAVRFFRPGILFRNSFSVLNGNFMIRNYTKIAARQILKNKTFSCINVAGLTIGVAVCLMVVQYVSFEKSFDDFQTNADRLYRVNLYNTHNGVFDKITPQTPPSLGYHIKESIPGVADVARVTHGRQSQVVRSGSGTDLKEFVEDGIVYADPSLFTMFSFDFVRGDEYAVFTKKSSVVVSQSIALQYFGEIDALDKTLQIDGYSYTIAGIFKDIPFNSNFKFDIVLPPVDIKAWNEDWAWSDVHTYVLLDPHVSPSGLQPGLSKIVELFHQDRYTDKYLLEPVKDIRLYAMDGSGRAVYTYFFSILGFIIILLAWFNYINLSTAKSIERAKEVGVRKIVGGTRKQLICQFLFESLVLNLVSVTLALILFYICWPLVYQFLEQPFQITLWNESWFWLSVIGFLFTGTVCSGFYPAFFLSSVRPFYSFKDIPGNWNRAFLRRSLIVVQFSVSIVLITGVLVIYRQIDFMRKQDLGIAIDQTLIIEEPLMTNRQTAQAFNPFVDEILKHSSIRAATHATSFPGAEIGWHRTDIKLQSEDSEHRYNSRIIAVGYNFLETFGLPLTAGRNFDPSIENDQISMLLNEEACKMFGFQQSADALGKYVFIGSKKCEVIGVVKNYHYVSLQNKLQPILYFPGSTTNPKYAVKISGENISTTIAFVEKEWKKAYAGNVFRYYFLDDFFDHQYATDRKLGLLVGSITSIAIIISCLGLFGLSLYAVLRRTKEIGIRKVLGASVHDVIVLLSNDLGKIIIAGSVIGVPLAYYMVQLWLQRYTYKMSVDLWLFIIPLLSIIILAAVTISYQTVCAARKNPVDSLKYE